MKTGATGRGGDELSYDPFEELSVLGGGESQNTKTKKKKKHRNSK
jgi:hypothetical protein